MGPERSPRRLVARTVEIIDTPLASFDAVDVSRMTLRLLPSMARDWLHLLRTPP